MAKASRTIQALADAAADRYGVPRWLYRNLIRQESGWNPDAHNPSGATGLVQIHLPSHPDISEAQARNPAFAADWGARYLAAQKARFGRWDLALAAYNAGPGNVEKHGGVPPFAETQNYVKNIMRGRAAAAAPRGRRAAPAVSGVMAAPPPRGQGSAPLSNLLASAFASNNELLGLDTPDSVLSMLAAPVAAPALPPSSGRAQVPQGLPLREGGTPPSGLNELFFDPRGAYDEGQFIKPIGGHSDHLHASITNPQQMIWLINEAQKRGLSVRENPYVDPVDPVHTTGSFHGRNFSGKYNGRTLGQGVDISGGDLGRLFDDILARFGVKR